MNDIFKSVLRPFIDPQLDPGPAYCAKCNYEFGSRELKYEMRDRVEGVECPECKHFNVEVK